MTRSILLFILLVYSKLLFSAEVTLRSENIFICDVLEENSDFALIRFQNQKYKIPRSEILEIKTEITGKHTSYKNTVLTLVDGTTVKGRLTEESSELITIRKENELLAIPKGTISNRIDEENKPYSLPESYLVIEKEKQVSTWNLGFYGIGMKNGSRLGETNHASYGGGFFIEPAFLKMNDKLLFGFQTEYLSSSGGLSYSFFQNYLYVQFNQISFGLNFYYKVGLGTSYITLTESEQSVGAFKGSGIFETGWQNLISEKYILKIGMRGNAFFEKPVTVDMIGYQFSIGYRL